MGKWIILNKLRCLGLWVCKSSSRDGFGGWTYYILQHACQKISLIILNSKQRNGLYSTQTWLLQQVWNIIHHRARAIYDCCVHLPFPKLWLFEYQLVLMTVVHNGLFQGFATPDGVKKGNSSGTVTIKSIQWLLNWLLPFWRYLACQKCGYMIYDIEGNSIRYFEFTCIVQRKKFDSLLQNLVTCSEV